MDALFVVERPDEHPLPPARRSETPLDEAPNTSRHGRQGRRLDRKRRWPLDLEGVDRQFVETSQGFVDNRQCDHGRGLIGRRWKNINTGIANNATPRTGVDTAPVQMIGLVGTNSQVGAQAGKLRLPFHGSRARPG